MFCYIGQLVAWKLQINTRRASFMQGMLPVKFQLSSPTANGEVREGSQVWAAAIARTLRSSIASGSYTLSQDGGKPSMSSAEEWRCQGRSTSCTFVLRMVLLPTLPQSMVTGRLPSPFLESSMLLACRRVQVHVLQPPSAAGPPLGGGATSAGSGSPQRQLRSPRRRRSCARSPSETGLP